MIKNAIFLQKKLNFYINTYQYISTITINNNKT